MKALSIIQPWASLIAVGAKRIETRSWGTGYRGPLVIHASKKFGPDERDYASRGLFLDALEPHYLLRPYPDLFEGAVVPELQVGCIVATANLVDCLAMDDPFSEDGLADWVHKLSEQERAFGLYEPERFGWFFEDIVRLETPVPAKGALGLWEWSGSPLFAMDARCK